MYHLSAKDALSYDRKEQRRLRTVSNQLHQCYYIDMETIEPRIELTYASLCSIIIYLTLSSKCVN